MVKRLLHASTIPGNLTGRPHLSWTGVAMHDMSTRGPAVSSTWPMTGPGWRLMGIYGDGKGTGAIDI